jgi:hypothetical protein
MATALVNAGCTVEAVCPPRHPLSKTSAVQRTHRYKGLMPLMSFADAIAATRPDLILPGDDLATRHLHDLYFQKQGHGRAGTEICALIERSLGAPESFRLVYARTISMRLAQDEGIRVPETEVITNTNDLQKWVAQMGFPAVLKADATSGGDGVRIARTPDEAERMFRDLQAPPLLARAAKRAVMDRDRTLVWPSLLRRRSVVNVQALVLGREATSLVACWKGTVLAGMNFEVLKKLNSSGPATVMRLIENADMSTAAEKMVRRLGLSGMVGFDFMLEAQTGNAYLIEVNPRTTQVGHLTLGPGRDLPAALYAAVTGKVVQEAPKVTENDTFALFPQEWTRDPASAYLRSGYHDVPLEEPELVRACLRTRRRRRAWYSQREWVKALTGDRLPRL